MGRSRRATLADVAVKAGVSAITVSRALRHPGVVSPATRARIDQAVAELGYVPDPAARALASGRTNVVGVLIPSVTNNVFSDVLRGIFDEVEGAGFEVQLGNTRYSPELEAGLLRVFLGQKPAGMIVAGIDQSPEGAALLRGAPCPVVQVMETGPDPFDMMVGFSHREAAAAAARHLAAQGYRRPAFIGARMDPRTRRRFDGFRAAAEEAGVFDPARVVTTEEPSTVALGAALFGGLIEARPETDAVFCINDDLALGVLFEARRRGVAVPEALGLCGFNDFEAMAAAEPPVTSVRTHRYEMGRRAVALLRARLDEGLAEAPSIDLGFQVVPRRSTAR